MTKLEQVVNLLISEPLWWVMSVIVLGAGFLVYVWPGMHGPFGIMFRVEQQVNPDTAINYSQRWSRFQKIGIASVICLWLFISWLMVAIR